MRRNWFLLLLCLYLFGTSALAQAAQRPNVIFILADDLGYGDPGCYNPESKIPTPNIDRLAEQGMRLTDAHSASAVCTPTRYGILTGRYCWRTRLKKAVLWPYAMPLIERDRLTLPEIFKEHGYATICLGKWHLGMKWPRNDGRQTPADTDRLDDKVIDLGKPVLDGPCDHGFDRYFGVDLPCFPPYCFLENNHVVGPVPDRPKPRNMIGEPGRMQKGWTFERVLPMLGEKADEYIWRHATQHPDQPFFMYLPLTAPHTPITPNKPFQGKSQATLYGDFVVETDAVVGRVLGALDETGLTKNTIAVFTSDNGSPGRNGHNMAGPYGSCTRDSGHRPNAPWRGRKGDIHEGGHRVPLIVRWPGHVRPHSTNDALICLNDFYATLAALLGHDLPDDAGEDSFNMLPELLGKNLPGPIRTSLIHHSHLGKFAIRQGDWKLIRCQGSGSTFTEVPILPDAPAGQLYNLKDDPQEKKNLYRERPDIVQRLSKMLDEQIKSGRTRPVQRRAGTADQTE
ncbi:MAG: arylsulfatase [Pirellulales bacterium]|nr:arylsulfatase [Pirellulales bacterium]